MTSTSTVGFNGKAPRKTLADQLDRLDAIIDALAAGLNETVADVVRQAVTAAVQQTLEGLAQAALSNPDLLRRLTEQFAPPAAAPQAAHEAGPSHPGPARRALSRAWSWLKGCKVWARRGWQAARRRLGLALARAAPGGAGDGPGGGPAGAGVGPRRRRRPVRRGRHRRRAAGDGRHRRQEDGPGRPAGPGLTTC